MRKHKEHFVGGSVPEDRAGICKGVRLELNLKVV